MGFRASGGLSSFRRLPGRGALSPASALWFVCNRPRLRHPDVAKAVVSWRGDVVLPARHEVTCYRVTSWGHRIYVLGGAGGLAALGSHERLHSATVAGMGSLRMVHKWEAWRAGGPCLAGGICYIRRAPRNA